MDSEVERLLIDEKPELTVFWKPELAKSTDRYMELMRRCQDLTAEERQEFHDLMDSEMNEPIHPERSECIDDYRRFLPSIVEEHIERQDRPSDTSQQEISELDKLLAKTVLTEKVETTISDELLPFHDPANPVSFVIGKVRYSYSTKEEAIESFLQKVNGLPEGEYVLDNGRRTRSKAKLKDWIRNL